MRRAHWLMVLGVLGGVVSGCNCTGREFTVKRTFSVTQEVESAACATESRTVNLQDDAAFSDLKNNLGKVELRKVVVTIVNPKKRDDSVATTAHGTVSVKGSSEGSVLAELGTYAPMPITAGSTQNIDFDSDASSTLASLALNPPYTFDVVVEGCSDKTTAFYDFEVALTFYVELKLF